MLKVEKENDMFRITNTLNGIIIHYPKSVFTGDSRFYKYDYDFFRTFYFFFYPGMPFNEALLEITTEAQEFITELCEVNRILA